MPKKGTSDCKTFPIQFISFFIYSSLSLALIGPPKITIALYLFKLVGKLSPKEGRLISKSKPLCFNLLAISPASDVF